MQSGQRTTESEDWSLVVGRWIGRSSLAKMSCRYPRPCTKVRRSADLPFSALSTAVLRALCVLRLSAKPADKSPNRKFEKEPRRSQRKVFHPGTDNQPLLVSGLSSRPSRLKALRGCQARPPTSPRHIPRRLTP